MILVLITKTSDQTRQRGGRSLYLYSSQLSPGHLVLLPLLPCHSLLFSRLSELAAMILNQPFLIYVFSTLSTQVSPVSHMASTTLVRFLALLRLSSAFPDPILVPVPVILVPVPISATALVSVPAPVPVPLLCSSTGLHPRPILRSFVRRSVPVPIAVCVLVPAPCVCSSLMWTPSRKSGGIPRVSTRSSLIVENEPG